MTKFIGVSCALIALGSYACGGAEGFQGEDGATFEEQEWADGVPEVYCVSGDATVSPAEGIGRLRAARR